MGSNWDQILDDSWDCSHLVTLVASSDVGANRQINKELWGPNVAHIGIFKPRVHILEVVKGTRVPAAPAVIQMNSEQVTEAVERPSEVEEALPKQHQGHTDVPVSIGLF
jgi:hypothetical protein